MFKKLLVVVIVVASLAGLIGVASALFTSTKVVDNNAFTSGTLVLTTDPTTAVVHFINMAPGDYFYAPIQVNNAGTLPLRYAVTSTATNTDTLKLMEVLTMTIKLGVTTCSGVGFNDTGTTLYDAFAVGSAAGINVIGDPTQGNQTGDRTLVANSNETLCIQVKLPITTTNLYQGAATTAAFTFAAEQTTNND